MGHKLSEKEKALYKATDEVLYYIWDPIGVSESPYARDEYWGYLPQVFKMLINDNSDKEIETYLQEISSERMGICTSKKHTKKVVEILLEYKDKINDDNL